MYNEKIRQLFFAIYALEKVPGTKEAADLLKKEVRGLVDAIGDEYCKAFYRDRKGYVIIKMAPHLQTVEQAKTFYEELDRTVYKNDTRYKTRKFIYRAGTLYAVTITDYTRGIE